MKNETKCKYMCFYVCTYVCMFRSLQSGRRRQTACKVCVCIFGKIYTYISAIVFSVCVRASFLAVADEKP